MMLPDCCKNNVLLAVPFVFGAYLLGLVLGLVGVFWGFVCFFKGAENPSLAYALAGIYLLSPLVFCTVSRGRYCCRIPASPHDGTALDSCKRRGRTRQNPSPVH